MIPDYSFHLSRFLDYNQRRVLKKWRSEKEKVFIIQQEWYHQQCAAMLMPETEIKGIGLSTT